MGPLGVVDVGDGRDVEKDECELERSPPGGLPLLDLRVGDVLAAPPVERVEAAEPLDAHGGVRELEGTEGIVVRCEHVHAFGEAAACDLRLLEGPFSGDPVGSEVGIAVQPGALFGDPGGVGVRDPPE